MKIATVSSGLLLLCVGGSSELLLLGVVEGSSKLLLLCVIEGGVTASISWFFTVRSIILL